MEIKVGEYVRTEDGYIGKLVEYIPNALNYLKIDIGREIKHCDDSIDNFIYTRYGFQLKHSKNIIGLIGVGDYVNGHKVVSINSKIPNKIEVEAQAFIGEYFIGYEDINSIVTKEQFEKMENKI